MLYVRLCVCMWQFQSSILDGLLVLTGSSWKPGDNEPETQKLSPYSLDIEGAFGSINRCQFDAVHENHLCKSHARKKLTSNRTPCGQPENPPKSNPHHKRLGLLFMLLMKMHIPCQSLLILPCTQTESFSAFAKKVVSNIWLVYI